jgi:hypothetical protein
MRTLLAIAICLHTGLCLAQAPCEKIEYAKLKDARAIVMFNNGLLAEGYRVVPVEVRLAAVKKHLQKLESGRGRIPQYEGRWVEAFIGEAADAAMEYLKPR